MSLVVLSSSSSQQLKATEETNKAIKRHLDYLIIFANGIITYAASNMVLWVHGYGLHLVEDRTKRRSGGHYFSATSSKKSTTDNQNLTDLCTRYEESSRT